MATTHNPPTDTHDEQRHLMQRETDAPASSQALALDGARAAASPALLGDARLSGRGNGPVRQAVLQRMQQTHGNRATRAMVQRAGSAPLPEPAEDVGARIQARAGGGNALSGDVQRTLESGIGSSMSNVRVHTDGEADHLARSVDSVAFTTGSDIFFRSGAYNPSSSEGLHLLAHEATHTVQQAAGPVAGTPTAGGISVSDPSDSFERAADSAAHRVASGQAVSSAPAAAAGPGSAAVQRAADEEEPVQTMRAGRVTPVQRAADEEEPVQTMRAGRYTPVQRAADEEEPVQTMRAGRYTAVQRAADEEEPPVQTMRASQVTPVQRAADEEEPVQTRRAGTYAAVQRVTDEETVQAMRTSHYAAVQRAAPEEE